MKLLSINAGSSSLKFRLYEMPEEEVIIKGIFEKIGEEGSFYSISLTDKKIKKEVSLKTHSDAVKILIEELLENKVISSLSEIASVGHRVVNGGSLFSKSVTITDKVLDDLESIVDMAPLHNPAALKGMYAFKENIPNAHMVVCFDTAFHQTMDEATYLYPVPYEWYEKYAVRKYGFHGLSHKYITEQMTDILHKQPNLIICHIGSGASITAVKEGKCIDTSMGFTPMAGIMMGTRCGDIDSSLISYVLKKTGKDIAWMDNELNKQSGLQGITGKSDLRDIDEGFLNKDPKFVLGMDMYSNKIVNYIGEYFLKLNGKVDAICFTAGGGENDPLVRSEVLKKLTALGIEIDEHKNEETVVRLGKEGIITKESSKIPVYVLGTDEELMIARDTYAICHK